MITLSILPALAFFLLAERRLVGGLVGAVKG
jgi:ABC-type glycerol-3-phosphate transport system permease component